jgi:hypothetical protein
MKNQPIHQESTQSNSNTTLSWLSLLHLWLTYYFKERIAQDELDILMNSLSHLYDRADTLYSSSLPALNSSNQETRARYDTWTSLRAVKRHIERIELLCHLLVGATASVLDVLGHLQIQEVASQEEHSFIASQEAWDTALAALHSNIEQWHHTYLEQPSFVNLFAERFAPSGALVQFDNACTLVLHSSSAIFRDILPDVQAIGSGDDEALATIFLDMTQHTDQILLHIESLLEPLQMLIKQFALPSGIE